MSSNFSKVVNTLIEIAEQGLAVAQFNLGRCCEDEGRFNEAADWYKKAANQGLEIAKIYWHICCR